MRSPEHLAIRRRDSKTDSCLVLNATHDGRDSSHFDFLKLAYLCLQQVRMPFETRFHWVLERPFNLWTGGGRRSSGSQSEFSAEDCR